MSADNGFVLGDSGIQNFIDLFDFRDQDTVEELHDWFVRHHNSNETVTYKSELKQLDMIFASFWGLRDIFVKYAEDVLTDLDNDMIIEIVRAKVQFWLDMYETTHELQNEHTVIEFKFYLKNMLGNIESLQDLILIDDPEFEGYDYSARQLDFLLNFLGNELFAEQELPQYSTTYEEYIQIWNDLIKNSILRVFEKLCNDKGVSETVKDDILALIEGEITKPEFHLMSLDNIFFYLEEMTKTVIEIIVGENLKVRKAREAAPQTNARSLTHDEINSITDVVVYPSAWGMVAVSAEGKVRRGLALQLERVIMEPNLIPDLRRVVAIKFKGAIVKKGHKVGLIAAQTLGEQATQAGLRSFQHAGQSGDSGFDRIDAITKLKDSSKNPITIITLKGNPTWVEARTMASHIETNRVGDLCKIEVGLSNPNVQVDIFGGLPVFPEEPWHRKFLEIHTTRSNTARGPYQRPNWIIKLTMDKDKLFQRRISMHQIANAIEGHPDLSTGAGGLYDIRVVYSSISIGVMEVWHYTDEGRQQPRAEIMQIGPDYNTYIYLLRQIAQEKIAKIEVTKVAGFSNAMIQRVSFAGYIRGVIALGNGLLVEFDQEDFMNNNLPVTQICEFLAMKASTPDNILTPNNVHYRNDKKPSSPPVILQKGQFWVVGSRKGFRELRNDILNVETITLSSVVESKNTLGNTLNIKLNKNMLLRVHQVNIDLALRFFNGQKTLPEFSSVNILISREELSLKISPNNGFNAQFVYDQLRMDGAIDPRVFQNAPVILENGFNVVRVPGDVPSEPIQRFVRRYGSSLRMTFDNHGEQVTLKFTLHPLTPDDAWNNIEKVGGNDTLFISEKRERLGYRFRILAKGFALEPLTYLSFVDMNGCISAFPREMENKFGIEVGRAHVYGELLANGGKDIASRHIALLADIMSYQGKLIPISKKGKEDMGAGPFARAAVQETYKTLIEAQMKGAVDTLNSTVSKTLIGNFETDDNSDVKAGEFRHDELKSTMDELMSLGKRLAPKADVPVKAPIQPRPKETERGFKIVQSNGDLSFL